MATLYANKMYNKKYCIGYSVNFYPFYCEIMSYVLDMKYQWWPTFQPQNCLCGYFLTALEASPLKKFFKIILKVLCLVSSTAVHFPRCCVTDKNKFLNIIWETNF